MLRNGSPTRWHLTMMNWESFCVEFYCFFDNFTRRQLLHLITMAIFRRVKLEIIAAWIHWRQHESPVNSGGRRANATRELSTIKIQWFYDIDEVSNIPFKYYYCTNVKGFWSLDNQHLIKCLKRIVFSLKLSTSLDWAEPFHRHQTSRQRIIFNCNWTKLMNKLIGNWRWIDIQSIWIIIRLTSALSSSPSFASNYNDNIDPIHHSKCNNNFTSTFISPHRW